MRKLNKKAQLVPGTGGSALQDFFEDRPWLLILVFALIIVLVLWSIGYITEQIGHPLKMLCFWGKGWC